MHEVNHELSLGKRRHTEDASNGITEADIEIFYVDELPNGQQTPKNLSRRAESVPSFKDGNVLLEINQQYSMRLHRSYLQSLSPLFYKILKPRNDDSTEICTIKVLPHMTNFPRTLIMHIYHIQPMTKHTQFETLSQIIMISHPSQLNFPSVFDVARSYLLQMYPCEPLGSDYKSWNNVREATRLSLQTGIRETLKPLFYALITVSDFEIDEPSESSEEKLDARITKCCVRGMRAIMDHFTPILFTPPPTAHMPCTDKLADQWMLLVLTPALQTGGVYKPLETLANMRNVNWEGVGICQQCRKDKEEEWRREAEVIWSRLEGWLELESCFTRTNGVFGV